MERNENEGKCSHNGPSKGQRRSARGVVPHQDARGVGRRSDSDDHFHPEFALVIDGGKEEARAIGTEDGYETIAKDDSWFGAVFIFG
ncbi:hypothetical protein TIFTF001_043907 [Ficus carica]|uniref:Uncharacterized protein n=1 Tax=Ficus carica TaxID=3494 RepID=A0AA87Z6Q2_FICCA|nr:hypothetical protein TIFTF001_043907 [Ficus carica]